MSRLREVVPGIYSWSEYSQEKQLNFNGYFVVRQGEAVLIDPPPLDEEGIRELEELVSKNSPLQAFLLTNVHHERASADLKSRFSVPVCIHASDRDAMESPADRTFKEGDPCLCGFEMIPLQHQKSPGETAFLLQAQKILIVGDALIGKVPGEINLLPAEKYDDVEKARQGLKVLEDYDFDTLLVGDGESILSNAKPIVSDFLRG